MWNAHTLEANRTLEVISNPYGQATLCYASTSLLPIVGCYYSTRLIATAWYDRAVIAMQEVP
ncbi:uncharacterized protein BO96DRAFT_407880 [Aspergillus niger CBS 101883]|uniref:uncharacterized protein n=1 Tax=Aspergillus lacticoffeatus (strain CBS 101883) TaxID=1450533 RepID=UPI000D805686|nr:uncharacterized protein BO96DRAFT_407880 [Aspergillus niger CBS 101883]PYH60980.1 hypothetical protein BO96DRAFT_407880 [Aspergillus niger CBS 101883]